MAKSKLVFGAVCLAAFLTGAAIPGSAAPVSLAGGFTLPGVSVSGTLNGDLAGNVLTLNSSAPLSAFAVQMSNSPLITIPSTKSVTVSCAVATNCLIVTGSSSYQAAPNFSQWGVNLAGTVDLGTGATNLAGSLQTPATIFSDGGVVTPTFTVTVDPSLGPIDKALAQPQASALQAALNASGTTATYTASGNWTADTFSVLSTGVNVNGSNVQLDLGVQNDLSGVFTAAVDLSFSPTVDSLVGSGLETYFENNFSTDYTRKFQDYLSTSLDYSDPLFTQDCQAATTSVQPFAIDCTTLSQISLPGTLPGAAPSAGIPEPATLAVFGLGLFCLGGMCRERARRRARRA